MLIEALYFGRGCTNFIILVHCQFQSARAYIESFMVLSTYHMLVIVGSPNETKFLSGEKIYWTKKTVTFVLS